MAANTSTNLVSLDFDTNKANLITFLKNQQIFSDYDFTGSNINVLLDVLSYNTYLNAFYLNMIAAEMFLDSAQMKSSVVSLSKSLNYVPRSYKSAIATITCVFPQSGLQNFLIPSGTRFTGKNANGSYIFSTSSTQVLYPVLGSFTTNLEISEGKSVQDTFIIDNTIENQRFVLQNNTVDTNSLIVNVIENNGANNTLFAATPSLFGLTSESNAYFLQAQNDGYEVVFGDDMFGRHPLNGAIVKCSYIVTSGTDGNGATSFILDDNLGAKNQLSTAVIPTITTVQVAYNGANAESIDSIRYNAPRSFQTQERAITTGDYKQLILQNFTNVKTLHVYGGETLSNAVSYGIVFIAPLTFSGYTLTDSEKTDIEQFILVRNTIGLVPKIIDPDFLYLQVNTTVKYNPSTTTLSPAEIQASVQNAIVSYSQQYLEDFNTEFKYSNFVQHIDNADLSISSNETHMTMKKEMSPELNISQYISVSFDNSIKVGTFTSSSFMSGGKVYMYTDVNSKNNTFSVVQNSVSGAEIENTSNQIYLSDITASGTQNYVVAGSIDYMNGLVTLDTIIINDFLDNPGINFYATPQNENVLAKNNNVIEIDINSGINCIVEAII